MVSCESIHDGILKHLAERTSVEHLRDLCVVTVPIRTVDGRLVDVFVESRSGDYFLVHDGGKAANELILQGVNITPSINRNCESLAARFNVQWIHETFQSHCKIGQLNSAILGVAMCSSLATVHLLEHVAEPEEEAVREQFGVALRQWSKRRARVKDQVAIAGKWKQHRFDFVAYPKASPPIAISVLSPSGNPAMSADRAAFRALDLEGTSFEAWRKVNVETKAESWSGPSEKLLAKCSDVVIQLNSGETPTPSVIDDKLGDLLAA